MAQQKGLRSPTARTRATSTGRLLYHNRAFLQSIWHGIQAGIILRKLKSLEKKAKNPLQEAAQKRLVNEAKVELAKSAQRALVISTRDLHQNTNSVKRKWEVEEGRKTIRKFRKRQKELIAEREKIDQEFGRKIIKYKPEFKK